MNKAYLAHLTMLTVMIGLTTFANLAVSQEAHAHGVSTCPTSNFIRIENEQIEPAYILQGDTIRVKGELSNMVNREITINSSSLSVIDKDKVRGVMNDLEYFSKCNPPPPSASSFPEIKATDWEVVRMSYEHGLTLKPGATIPYEIELRNARPGVFQLSTGVVFTPSGSNQNETMQFGRGMEVNVYSKDQGTATPQSYSVETADDAYSFNYTMYGAKSVTEVHADTTYRTLSMILTSGNEPQIGAAREGIIDVAFPKKLLDATFGPHQFLVFVDGTRTEHHTSYSSCDKVIMQIHFFQGAQKIALVRSDVFQLAEFSHSPKSFVVEPQVTASSNNTYVLPTDTDASKCLYTIFGDENRLHVDIEGTNENGYFSILLRDWLLHGNYSVYVDGQPMNHSDLVMPDPDSYDERFKLHYLTIDYPKGAKSIDIIGTAVIPEFGSLSVLVAASGVVSVMVLLSRLRAGSNRNWNSGWGTAIGVVSKE